MLSATQERIAADLRDFGGRLECYRDGRWRFSASGMRPTLLQGATVDALLHEGLLIDTENAVAIEHTLVLRGTP